MITIACVLRQGGKVGYDASWVEKLQTAVARNLSIAHTFVCLSDCDVPCERIPLDSTGSGFWAKLQLFKPNLFANPVLYLDLDTVICKPIDEIVSSVQDQQFVMWHEYDRDIHSSAMMWWQGDHSYLWDIYCSQSPEYWKELYSKPPLYGDQALISEHTNHTLFTDYVPSKWFHIAGNKDREEQMQEVKILHFRKTSKKPSTMTGHPLVQQHWH